MRGRRAFASGLAAVAALLACALPAGAAAPPSQVGDLRPGTAILAYDGARARSIDDFHSALTRVGVRTVFFERQRMVAVRGTSVELRRAARLRGVRSAHMDRVLKYALHESVPLIYGGTHDSTWASGVDGRGGSVAVVDTGVDGLHPDLMGRMSANVKVLDPGNFFDEGEPVYLECPAACSTDTTGGHGTHVAGTVAGDGTASDGFYRGVAPGSQLVGLGVGEVITVLYAVGAFEWILANHQAHGIVAVNNSWGPDESSRFDASDPINVGSKAMNDAGMAVVFAAGNSGPGPREDPPGASDCSSQPSEDGGRESTGATCMINSYSVAPWALSVANGRKDYPGGPGGQPLAYTSSRGDPDPRQSLDGQTIEYVPTLTAPGTNIRATRMITGVNTTGAVACGSAEAPSCIPPPGAEQYEPFYHPLSGTSMASPHVAGAVAVMQSQARASLGRRLSPAEIRQILIESATPMTMKDGFYEWPCGSLDGVLRPCGDPVPGKNTGTTYQRWQVGAGYLNVAAALERVRGMAPATSSESAPTTQPALPPPPAGTTATPVRTTLPATEQRRAAQRRRAAYRRCLKRANRVKRATRKQTRRARSRAKARCRARYG